MVPFGKLRINSRFTISGEQKNHPLTLSLKFTLSVVEGKEVRGGHPAVQHPSAGLPRQAR